MVENLEAALATASSIYDLVPGDTEGLTLVADAMRRQAAVLDDGGSALSRVEVTSWRGPASQGFASTIEVEPGRWRTAADAFIAGATTIEAYVSAFPAARDLAARALEAYREYQQRVAASGLPTARSLSPAMAVGARIEALQQAQLSGHGAVADAEALRRNAIALLASARSVIGAAGMATADALRRAAEPAPQARRFWESNIRPADAIGAGHGALAAGGFLPGVGAWFDGVNAGWYAAEGNWGEAGWSAVALVPLAGDWLAASRRTARAIDLGLAIQVSQRVPRGPSSGPGWLLTHEVDGSHTIERHVGATRTYLVSRLYGQNAIKLASSFTTMSDAEKYVSRALAEGDSKIQKFLASSTKQRTSFVVDLHEPVGYGVSSITDGVETLSSVEVRLIKDAAAPDGYRVWTAFPTKGQ